MQFYNKMQMLKSSFSLNTLLHLNQSILNRTLVFCKLHPLFDFRMSVTGTYKSICDHCSNRDIVLVSIIFCIDMKDVLTLHLEQHVHTSSQSSVNQLLSLPSHDSAMLLTSSGLTGNHMLIKRVIIATICKQTVYGAKPDPFRSFPATPRPKWLLILWQIQKV